MLFPDELDGKLGRATCAVLPAAGAGRGDQRVADSRAGTGAGAVHGGRPGGCARASAGCGLRLHAVTRTLSLDGARLCRSKGEEIRLSWRAFLPNDTITSAPANAHTRSGRSRGL